MTATPSTMLALGTALPAFRLPDLDGRLVSPDEFARRRCYSSRSSVLTVRSLATSGTGSRAPPTSTRQSGLVVFAVNSNDIERVSGRRSGGNAGGSARGRLYVSVSLRRKPGRRQGLSRGVHAGPLSLRRRPRARLSRSVRRQPAAQPCPSPARISAQRVDALPTAGRCRRRRRPASAATSSGSRATSPTTAPRLSRFIDDKRAHLRRLRVACPIEGAQGRLRNLGDVPVSKETSPPARPSHQGGLCGTCNARCFRICRCPAIVAAILVAPSFATAALPDPRSSVDVRGDHSDRDAGHSGGTATAAIDDSLSRFHFIEPTELPPADAPPVEPRLPVIDACDSCRVVGFPAGHVVGGDLTAPPLPPVRNDPVRVGGVIRPPTRVDAQPVYPPIAQAARKEATVILEAVIDEKGNVRELRVLRGHPLFDDAAVQAVARWQFTPTLLNGNDSARRDDGNGELYAAVIVRSKGKRHKRGQRTGRGSKASVKRKGRP